MLKDSLISPKTRQADYPIDPLFLNRWSPRALSREEIPENELFGLFEAARWAPSSYNNQPWRFVYGRRNTEAWNTLFNLLNGANQIWAKNAAALLVMISKETLPNEHPSITHSFDAGAAWMSLALQGARQGWFCHGMEGFDYDRARKVLAIPDDYQIEAMAAIGRMGDKRDLPENLRSRETPSGRKKVAEFAFDGTFKY